MLEVQHLSLDIQRVESELFSAQSPSEIENLLDSHKSLANLFLHAQQYPDISILTKRLFELTQDPHIDTLYKEAESAFGDFEETELILADAIGRMKTLFPEMSTPRVETIVTGLYNDLIISDTLIIIGLDHFIGEGATYRPLNIPNYILQRYDKAHLPAIIMKFLAGPKIAKGDNETLLSEMIDFGKTYYLLSQLMPCTSDSILIGFTPEAMQQVTENEAVIWANFVENEILYSRDHQMKQKFLSERPNVYEISKDCPGRIGAWVGWKIVQSYMRNQDTSVKELIGTTNNEKIFQQSGYKPKG